MNAPPLKLVPDYPQVEESASHLARIRALEDVVVHLSETIESVRQNQQTDAFSAVVHSCDLDKVLAAMVLATASASIGIDVRLFFTFWGAAVLRREKPAAVRRPLLERLFGWMLPKGANDLELSRMKTGGLGTEMVKRRMSERGIASLDEMFGQALELGVKIYACEMSLGLVGLRLEDMREPQRIRVCGATAFLEQAMRGKVTLFF